MIHISTARTRLNQAYFLFRVHGRTVIVRSVSTYRASYSATVLREARR